MTKTGLNFLAREPDKAIVIFASDNELTEFRKRLENYSQIQDGPKYEYLGAIDELVPLEPQDRIGRLLELRRVHLSICSYRHYNIKSIGFTASKSMASHCRIKSTLNHHKNRQQCLRIDE